jgi:methylmalonyl-CoA mutase N-terminal domain/subunit
VVDPSAPPGEERQKARLAEVRAARDDEAVTAVLARVAADARRPDVNLMPVIIDAVRAYATEGEIVSALGDVFGYWAFGEGLPA